MCLLCMILLQDKYETYLITLPNVDSSEKLAFLTNQH